MNDHQNEIGRHLCGIENSHNVKILFACEAGSRAWGYPSQSSDHDVRFVYVRPMEQYLAVDRYLKDAQTKDHIVMPKVGALDFEGWDLRKALALVARSDMNMLERLGSNVVYRREPGIAVLETLSKRLFNPTRCWGHHMSMVNRTWIEHRARPVIEVKPYLRIVRSLLAACWVAEHQTIPPTWLPEMLDKLTLPPQVCREVQTLMFLRRDGQPPVSVSLMPGLHSLLMDMVPQIGRKFDHREATTEDYEAVDAAFRVLVRAHQPLVHRADVEQLAAA